MADRVTELGLTAAETNALANLADGRAARNSPLLDKRLLSRFYRSATLAGTAARTGWVQPDLAPFPWQIAR